MKSIKKTYEIKARVSAVWQALIDPKEISAWGAGPATMVSKAGTKFKLWGGDIYGVNTKVVKNKLIEQDWYGGDWKQASQCQIRLAGDDNSTKIELLHENVPDSEFDSIAEGWDSYYFGPMKQYLEKS